ncbi:PQ-loop repeat-containing protein [Bacillus andreraoultii]|uniref:PQ-loop repeat-containing protein n=1 Tax=Bacillus andreraoultii TaxID=1499685 RepID=UPI00053979E5|nr:PQ-loop repeat-containing protein [Bacillus andreraoultii]
MKILDFIFWTLFPTLSTICVIPSYVPQIVRTLKTKDVSGISTSFWWLIVGYIFFTWGSVIYTWIRTGVMGATLALTVNLASAVTMLVLVLKYRKNDDTIYLDLNKETIK